MTRKIFILEREVRRIERVRVTAATLAEAMKAATKAEIEKVVSSPLRYTEVASWPADEEPEVVNDLKNGYRVRRGWFWIADLDYRSVCFLESDLREAGTDFSNSDTIFSTMRAAVKTLLGPSNETVMRCTCKYGYAASYGEMKTWSTLFETPELAYRSCRRFVEQVKAASRDKQRWVREQAEDDRLQSVIDKTLILMDPSGRLHRNPGGRWAPSHVPYTDGVPSEHVDIKVVRQMLDQGLVEVTDTMNKTGDPRTVSLTPAGKGRTHTAQVLASMETA
jgi:hypothetical protein